MRTSIIYTIFSANILSVLALDTIAGYTSDIPECAFSPFKKAMKSENCKVDDVDSSSFDCLCRHSSAISFAVAKEVDTQCSADFSQSVGTLCGLWLALGTTASELARATSILGEDLSGDSPNTASGSSATQSASNSAAAATATSTNVAAIPTVGSSVAGLLGGMAALAGVLI